LLGRRLLLPSYDHQRDRPLLPPLMRVADHRRLLHGGALDQCGLVLERADPFAARLDQVVGPVHDLYGALFVDHRHIARCQPAVVERLSTLTQVVARRDPGTTDLQLADALPVPRRLATIVTDNAGFDKGSG